MKYDIKGKKILILGASSSEIPLINRAQELGAYVIVTDRNINYDLSPAKRLADSAWDISWSDINSLEKKCKETKIDGVIAGYSEFRCENLIRLTERLNLPCYLTERQLEITRDKILFKKECEKYNIPVIIEFDYTDERIDYPVIVKPVDRGGSIGISIANDKKELDSAYKYAMDLSVKKEVIIEKYISNKNKIDLYYAVEEDKIFLISEADTIYAKNNNGKRVVQSSWLYPSNKESPNFDEIDSNIRKMIKGLGIRNGCLFFSGFLLDNNELSFFECGFRLEGAHQHGYVDRRLGFNYLDMFIYHSIFGRTEFLDNINDIDEEIKSVVVNIYSKGGKIKEVSGLNEISEINNCSFTLLSAYLGEDTSNTKAILDKVCIFSFCDRNPLELKKSLDLAYKLLKVKDEKGNDLIYDKVNTELIAYWWS